MSVYARKRNALLGIIPGCLKPRCNLISNLYCNLTRSPSPQGLNIFQKIRNFSQLVISEAINSFRKMARKSDNICVYFHLFYLIYDLLFMPVKCKLGCSEWFLDKGISFLERCSWHRNLWSGKVDWAEISLHRIGFWETFSSCERFHSQRYL